MSVPAPLPGEDTAYRDKKVGRRTLRALRRSLAVTLQPGEQVEGLFVSWRIRRSISLLVITDRRLLTLGDPSAGLPVVDDVPRSEVTELHVERVKTFSMGRVTAVTDADAVNLGTLDYGPETFLGLDEVWARGGGPRLPVIPTLGRPGAEPPPEDAPVGPSGGRHPLVAELESLADLHRRGALTDGEFAAAKARLLRGPRD
ncbi:SHOCT domain-containing protein [Serinicoccus kebangsaanensis]|uniref:SHOCT domain-containing protein n=1 Tax=Serinicoccus kebangsaanensis TaxID=2602069 RepID=UPI00178C6CD5|nr:SHOCT domain-containing protein [Serinicoccus kebangsaanensis]